MLTDRIFPGRLKSEIICVNNVDEKEETTIIIPAEFDEQQTKPIMTIMDLGKMLLQYCREGDTSKVHDLMLRGAPFSTDWLGTSPIHLAAMNNHISTCEVLLRAGISKDARTKVDRTPLHFAVFEGHTKMVELLLANNCDVDARDMLKMTPLHWSIQKKHKQITEMLLNNNADPYVISKFGKTPLILAQETGQDDIIKSLELVIRLRQQNPDQTQEATERLVFEMQQSVENNNNNNENDDNVELQQTPIDLDSEDSSTFQFNIPDQIQTNNNNMDDNLIDSDDGTSLSDAIIQLQNIEEPKTIDSSTLQMLKDHGISMLPTDDTDNSLITSALQSGRKLVLSEAGKLILTDPKFKKLTMDSTQLDLNKTSLNYAIQQTAQSNNKIAQINKQPNIVSTKNFPMKPNKVIKILSAEQFKQMCGGKKFTNDSNHPGIKMSTTKGTNILQITPQKFKRPVMQKNRLNINSYAKAANIREIKTTAAAMPLTFQHIIQPKITNTIINNTTNETIKPEIRKNFNSEITQILSPQQQQIIATEPTTKTTNGLMKHKLINGILTSSSDTDDIIINLNNTITKEEHHQQPPSLTWLDMERQILELKKANEEMWRQFEISQKLNEDFRIRLEKLEREHEILINNNKNS